MKSLILNNMTKKDYIIIANAIKQTEIDYLDTAYEGSYKDLLILNLEVAMSKDNPKFDPNKFREFIEKVY